MVRVGEEKVEKLVESPRVLIVEPPPQQTGEIEISVQEGNVTKTFRTRNISVLLHADDLHLKRGQTTVFTVTVKGLEELEERLPLYVTNHSRETVNLEGEGTVWIEPSAVNPEDGSFVFESSIVAHTSGSFRITATVIDEFAFALPIEPPDLGEADKGEIGDDEELDLPKKDEIDWEKVKKAIERAVKQHKEYWERRGKISPKKQGDEAQEGEQKADEKEEDDQDDENEDKKKDDEIKKLATELRELWKKLIKKIDEKADDKEIEAIHNEIKKKESELTKAIFRQAMEEIEGE
jgi:hypothetical protein